MNPSAVIFDFDGTIVDTETPAHLSMVRTWEAHGLELDQEWWLEGLGTARPSWVEALEDQLGRALDRADVMDQRRSWKDELTDRQPVLPGVAELIRWADAQGLGLAVASSSEHEWVDRHLERVGLVHHFDHVVCRDDVGGRAKPAPDVFLRATELLGIGATKTGVVEDSPHGLAAATAAGLRAVVVPNPLVRHLEFPDAAVALERLDAHPPVELLKLLAAS